MRTHDLARLLASLPDADVCTWDGEHREAQAVEQVIVTTTGDVVIGMEISAGWTVDGAAIVWTAHDLARRGLENAQARWVSAKLEWVG